MKDEERVYDNLPEVIDVQVEEDLDFELREPEDDDTDTSKEVAYKETIREEKVYEGYTEPKMIEATIVHEESVQEPVVEENEQKAKYDKKDKQSKKDTSFTSFKANQKASEKKWRKNVGKKISKFFWLILALIVGIPVVGFGGFFAVLGLGIAVMFCGMAVGMGIIGLGASAFLTTAGIASMGPVVFFGSLMGIGGGGLGLLLLLVILIWLKNRIIQFYKWAKKCMTEEVQ